MADTLTFTPQGTGGVALTVTPLPGSVQINDGNDDRGGSDVPQARAAAGKQGQCRVVVDDASPTQADLETLHETCATDAAGDASPVGTGDTRIVGAGDYADVSVEDALIDLSLEGESVQIATLSWKGNVYTPA